MCGKQEEKASDDPVIEKLLAEAEEALNSLQDAETLAYTGRSIEPLPRIESVGFRHQTGIAV